MDKEKRQKRIQQKENHIKKQVKLAKSYNFPDVKEPHRYAKTTWADCGNPNCFMCGNPRKFFKEITIQEKKHNEYADSFKDEKED